MIKVLIVDDSAFMRNALTHMLSSEPSIEVVGYGRDGRDALDLIKTLNPDVVTLDIEMPIMDGLTALEQIMKNYPRPVLMISSLTNQGAESTLKALDLGALDYLPKYQEGAVGFAVAQNELITKIKAIARRGSHMQAKSKEDSVLNKIKLADKHGSNLASGKSNAVAAVKKAPPVNMTGIPKRNIVVIGVSTGGPPAVQKVLAALPENFPACILIAQHMPKAFTNAFANRLASLCKIKVFEAKDGDKLTNGVAYICPGGQHISIGVKGALPFIKISEEPKDALYKPAANILNDSAAVLGNKVVGVTMTGMGSDGSLGTKTLKAKGGYIIAQDEASSTVYGMPKAVIEANLADEIVSLDDLADSIQKALYR